MQRYAGAAAPPISRVTRGNMLLAGPAELPQSVSFLAPCFWDSISGGKFCVGPGCLQNAITLRGLNCNPTYTGYLAPFCEWLNIKLNLDSFTTGHKMRKPSIIPFSFLTWLMDTSGKQDQLKSEVFLHIGQSMDMYTRPCCAGWAGLLPDKI